MSTKLFYEFFQVREIYLLSGLSEIIEGEFLYFFSMCYTAILDYGDFEISIICILDETPYT